jgi:hypothetical protein
MLLDMVDSIKVATFEELTSPITMTHMLLAYSRADGDICARMAAALKVALLSDLRVRSVDIPDGDLSELRLVELDAIAKRNDVVGCTHKADFVRSLESLRDQAAHLAELLGSPCPA